MCSRDKGLSAESSFIETVSPDAEPAQSAVMSVVWTGSLRC